MKKTFFAIALAAGLSAQAQTFMMQVDDITGTSTEYRVTDVDGFDAADPMTFTMADGSTRLHNGVRAVAFFSLPDLANQYQLRNNRISSREGVYEVSDFRAVLHYDVDAATASVTDYWLDANTCLSVDMLNQLVGANVDGIGYDCSSEDFRITKNRLNNNITLHGTVNLTPCEESLQYDGGLYPQLRFNLTLDPAATYAASGMMSVESFSTEPFSSRVGTVLYRPVAGIGGGSPTFVIGDAVTTSVEGMHDGHYALEVTLAGNRFKHGTVSLDDTDSYTVHLYNYETGKTIDVTSHYTGTITTLDDPETGGDNVYIDIVFTAEAGTSFRANYFGPITTVESLDGIAPQIKETNNVIITNDKGVQTLNQEITSMQVRESNDGTVYLYMMTDGTRPDDSMQTPCIQVSPAHINAGTLSLPELTEQWSVSFKTINVAYAKTEWHPAITNGTLSISKDESGKWDVTVALRNEYNNMGSLSGDGTSLTIHYAGEASAYTGTKK